MNPEDINSQRLTATLNSVSPERLHEAQQHVSEDLQEISLDPDGMDIATRMQLVLIDRYRRSARRLNIAIGLLLGCILGLIVGGFIGLDVQAKMAKVMTDQQAIINEQKAARKVAQEAKVEAERTKKQVEQASKKIDEAVEATPKIEIDAKGKAKVVLPVKPVSSSSTSAKAISSKQLPIEFRPASE